MSDLISRQAVNTLVDELARAISDERCFMSRGRSTGEIMSDILNLPSVENKSEWIPVTERLPKIAGVYRVARYYPNNVMNPNYLVDACCFDGPNTWYDDNRLNPERAYVKNIIAWQENPEPYKAEKGGE